MFTGREVLVRVSLRVGIRSGRNGRRSGGWRTHDGRSAGSRATSRTRARGRSARTGTPPWLAPRRESRLGTASRAGDVAGPRAAGAEPLCERGSAREKSGVSVLRFQQQRARRALREGLRARPAPPTRHGQQEDVRGRLRQGASRPARGNTRDQHHRALPPADVVPKHLIFLPPAPLLFLDATGRPRSTTHRTAPTAPIPLPRPPNPRRARRRRSAARAGPWAPRRRTRRRRRRASPRSKPRRRGDARRLGAGRREEAAPRRAAVSRRAAVRRLPPPRASPPAPVDHPRTTCAGRSSPSASDVARRCSRRRRNAIERSPPRTRIPRWRRSTTPSPASPRTPTRRRPRVSCCASSATR